MGFYLEGYYIGFETREFKNDDGSTDVRHSINIATGSLAYRCYMADNFDPADIEGLNPGTLIKVSCRVYVGKNGKLSVIDAQIVEP